MRTTRNVLLLALVTLVLALAGCSVGGSTSSTTPAPAARSSVKSEYRALGSASVREKLAGPDGSREVASLDALRSRINHSVNFPTRLGGSAPQAFFAVPELAGERETGGAAYFGGDYVAVDGTDKRFESPSDADAAMADMERLIDAGSPTIVKRVTVGGRPALAWNRQSIPFKADENGNTLQEGREVPTSEIWWFQDGRVKCVYGSTDSYESLIPAAEEMMSAAKK